MNPHRIFVFAMSLVVTCIATAARGADVPVLKSGFWEVTRTSPQKPDKKHLTTMCLDDSVQAEMREFGMGVAKEMCSQNDRRVEGNRMTSDATCKLGATTMKAHTVMVFNGNTSYHTEASATYDPPFMNRAESKSFIDGKWTGPCKPDQQPGDITTETGQKINMKALTKK